MLGHYAKVIGTGGYLPEKVLTNADLAEMVDTNDEWIVSRTGIKQRHIAAEGEMASSMAMEATRRALDAARISAEDIDLIVLATTTSDRVFPSTACRIQHMLGIGGFPAFDVQAVCSGYIYALDIANKYIRMGSASTALVIGTEVFSRILNWQDRSTCILFGDGAGAMILTQSDAPGIQYAQLYADGSHEDDLCVPFGVGENYTAMIEQRAYVEMNGKEVYKKAVIALVEIVESLLEKCQLTIDDIDWLVPHQANLRIINHTAKRLGLGLDKVITTIAEHGNTSAASVPLAYDIGVRDKRIRPGQKVILESFGGGFTWGVILLET